MRAERGRWLQKEHLKLAEAGSQGLRKEAISVTQKCKARQQVLTQELRQVLQKSQTSSSVKVAALNNRFSVSLESLRSEEDAR